MSRRKLPQAELQFERQRGRLLTSARFWPEAEARIVLAPGLLQPGMLRWCSWRAPLWERRSQTARLVAACEGGVPWGTGPLGEPAAL